MASTAARRHRDLELSQVPTQRHELFEAPKPHTDANLSVGDLLLNPAPCGGDIRLVGAPVLSGDVAEVSLVLQPRGDLPAGGRGRQKMCDVPSPRRPAQDLAPECERQSLPPTAQD